MQFNQKDIEQLVKHVITSWEETKSPLDEAPKSEWGIFEDMEDAIQAAWLAEKQYVRASLETRRKVIAAIRESMMKKEVMETICGMAIEETAMGNYQDKLIKHELAALHTPGVEDLMTSAWAGDDGLTVLELSPFGVIGAITPTTNPSESLINNGICMLAGGNTVVFSPHPKAVKTCHYTLKVMNKAIYEATGLENLMVTTFNPTIESCDVMMAHPKVNMLCATGGPGVVDAVLRSGKKAIGAGAGNPPAVVDETANIEKAAEDIINGCCFDNNMPCIAEKEVIAVDQICDYLIFNMKKHNAYEITDRKVMDDLAEMVYPNGRLNRAYVGKSAEYIAAAAGIDVPKGTRCLIMEAPADHLLVVEELMMPILPVVRVANVDEAIDLACKLEHGYRHTATMHSKNVDKLSEMAKRIQTTIFVKNGPSYAGLGVGGEGFPTFTIAGPTGEGLTSPKSFCRNRRCVLSGGFNIK